LKQQQQPCIITMSSANNVKTSRTVGRVAYGLFITSIVGTVIVAMAVYRLYHAPIPPLPTCSQEQEMAFRAQVSSLYNMPDATPSRPPELLGECAFRYTYNEARELFLSSAREAKAELHALPVVPDEGLFTDVAILRGSKSRFVIHISGIHGSEGFSGSATQSALLMHFSNSSSVRRAKIDSAAALSSNGNEEEEEKEAAPTVVLVHVANPFGMANNRRVNENNIDVNRNFLSNEDFAFVVARDPNYAGYKDLNYLINPTSQPFGPSSLVLNDLFGAAKTIYAALYHGIVNVKRALVAGNYYKQKGLGFGGLTRSASAQNLINLAQVTSLALSTSKRLVVVDVHTGLGLPGTDTLVGEFGSSSAAATTASTSEGGSEQLQAFERTFPVEMDASARAIGGLKETIPAKVSQSSNSKNTAMSGYELTIGTTGDLCRNWYAPHLVDQQSRLCVTQEFGTVPTLQVGKALVDENYAWFFGTDDEKRIYGQRLRNCFFLQETSWERAVVHRGMAVFFQAFDFASRS